MVLFFEDDKPKERTKWQKRRRLFIKIVLWIAVLMGVSLIVLGNIGGNSKLLKDGFESFLTQSSGYEAEIGSFNEMQFFPTAKLDIEDVVFKSVDGKTVTGTVDSVKASIGFWDVFFSNLRPRELKIEGVSLSSEFTGSAPLTIGKAELVQNEDQSTGSLKINGAYNTHSFNLRADIESAPLTSNKNLFWIGDQTPIKIEFADFVFSGFTKRTDSGAKFSIEDIVFAAEPLPVKASLEVKSALFSKTFHASMTSGSTVIHGDIDLSASSKADFVSDIFHLEDIAPIQKLVSSIGLLLAHKTPSVNSDLIDFTGIDMQIFFDIKDLRINDKTLGHVKIPLTIRDDLLRMQNATGQLAEGNLDAELVLFGANAASQSGTPSLTLDVFLKELNYALLQDILQDAGPGDAYVDTIIRIKGDGETYTQITESLNGKVSLIAGKGKMPGKALNVWGAGLVNAMLPSLDPKSEMDLHCVIANFDVVDGIATANPLFLDTKRVTVVGKGTVNFIKNKIKIQLETEPKEAAFLDVTPAVNISGALSKPEISISKLSALSKIGGLAVGLINPAFLAVSLTDLGVGDDHPCREFIDAPATAE